MKRSHVFRRSMSRIANAVGVSPNCRLRQLDNAMAFRKIERFRAGVEAGLHVNEKPPTFWPCRPLRRIPQGVRVRHRADLFNPERSFFATDLTALFLSRPTSRGDAGIQVRRTGAWDGGTLPAMRRRSAEIPARFADSEQIRVETLRRWDGRKFRKHHSIDLLLCPL